MTPSEALQCNIDAAQRELDQRNAEGEDVSHLFVCQRTGQILMIEAEKRAQAKWWQHGNEAGRVSLAGLIALVAIFAFIGILLAWRG